jgi:hypothetical protein
MLYLFFIGDTQPTQDTLKTKRVFVLTITKNYLDLSCSVVVFFSVFGHMFVQYTVSYPQFGRTHLSDSHADVTSASLGKHLMSDAVCDCSVPLPIPGVDAELGLPQPP